MIIGISGKKQCGKDTICTIIKAIDIYYNDDRFDNTKDSLQSFVMGCLEHERLVTLELYRDLTSKWEKHAYADKLKQVLSTLLNLHVGLFEDNTFKMSESNIAKPDGKGFYTHRELLQMFGTEVGRNISPNLWIDVLFNNYNMEDDYWIIPDVRFVSEAEAVKQHGGILIRVNRETGYSDNHISETALDGYRDFDYEIDNNDLEGTISKIEDIMRDNYLI